MLEMKINYMDSTNHSNKQNGFENSLKENQTCSVFENNKHTQNLQSHKNEIIPKNENIKSSDFSSNFDTQKKNELGHNFGFNNTKSTTPSNKFTVNSISSMIETTKDIETDIVFDVQSFLRFQFLKQNTSKKPLICEDYKQYISHSFLAKSFGLFFMNLEIDDKRIQVLESKKACYFIIKPQYLQFKETIILLFEHLK